MGNQESSLCSRIKLSQFCTPERTAIQDFGEYTDLYQFPIMET